MAETIAYLGPQGTFTEEAAFAWSRDKREKCYLPLASSGEVITSILRGRADKGILPLENSREGSVGQTLDILIDEEVTIAGEIILSIQHYLFILPGADFKKIKEIHSHPQALAQCRPFLVAHFPGAKEIPHLSTGAAAASVVAGKNNRAAVLASKRSGDIYGLVPLRAVLPEEACNQTRFIVLGRETPPPSGDDKTSFLFSVGKGPGLLYRVLAVFAASGIDLTKIESRPAKRVLGEYIFFLDCRGHLQDAVISSAQEEVRKKVPFLKVLGS
ncbi:MAG TPA: prephenate dehydratase, partial [Firmicutes bacterium]|nr:prephenate dehydratase [Bacillota bacterium]